MERQEILVAKKEKNGKKCPKGAEEKITVAIDEIIAEKSIN